MIYKPVSAQFEITEGCTHRCVHCYNHFVDNRNSNPADEKIMHEIAKTNLFYVTITGGEPLKVRPSLFRAIEIFREAHMDVSINTNLHLLQMDDVDRFKTSGIYSILSSILGPNAEIHDDITRVKGSFDRLLKSLELVSNGGLKLGLNMVVNRKNLGLVYETGKFLINSFGIRNFSATPMVPSIGKEGKNLMLDREEYISTLDSLLKLREDFKIRVDSLHPAIPCMFNDAELEKYGLFIEARGCVASKGTISFSPLGEVRVCSHERKAYGNILFEPLEGILEKMKEWSSNKLIPRECNPCAYIEKCRGGCRVSAEAIYGNLNAPDPYFIKPIKTKLPVINNEINDLKKLKIAKGEVRYRDEKDGCKTVYLNPRISARLDTLEFEVLIRFQRSINYEEISKEMGNVKITDGVIKSLARKGLIIKN